FGALTGRYATVSNYPGTTVEVSRGSSRLKDQECSVIDSPGVNTLAPTSEDERVTRDILLNEGADTVVQVMDAKNLRRGLLITLQLSEMGIPSVIALNMYDEAGERGIAINTGRLEEALGADVVPTIATQKWGLPGLKERMLSGRVPLSGVVYPRAIDDGIRSIEALLPKTLRGRSGIATMLLCADSTLDPWLKANVDAADSAKIGEIRRRVQSGYSEPIGFIINRERLKRVDAIVAGVVSGGDKKGGPVAEVLGRWSMHPVFGLFILAGVLFLMYEFVGVFGAGTSVNFLEKTIFGAYLNPWASRVVDAVVPFQFIRDLITGPYGLVTMGMTYAIAIVLPIVGYFFIFFSFLEDSGYLPRLAVIVDRVFRMMGLNGKAVLPMVLGLGCDTMATMTTRILETKKERVIVTLLLALGVPCSAQLGVILGMLGAVSLKATLLWGVVVTAVLFIVSFLASRVLPGDTSDFILEIPPIRMPQIGNIALKTMVRVEWYLKEAVPLFLIGTLALFALDRLRLITVMERAAAPVIVRFLGLPARTTGAFIIGFLRRDYGAAGLFALQKEGLLDPVQVVVSLVTMTLFVPCIANFFMIIKERGVKTALWMTAFIFPFAVIVGGMVNVILRGLNVAL
ncbi:MAG: ferrous iron transport protein B, partial [Deltaproteobacteria bacterium]|nr:ferrous iron transport protein B [Deltaproteobacteria bacterium]